MANAFLSKDPNKLSTADTTVARGDIWNRLQELKQEITQELVDDGPLCQDTPDNLLEDLALSEDSQEIEWHHRSQLEARLRDISDSQDRLVEGRYGKCVECGRQILPARLEADPVVSLCVKCQSASERETAFPTL